MSKSEFIVGPDFNVAALAEYKSLLTTAYENGAASGGSMDWSDVQIALEKAVEALGGEARHYMDTAEADGFGDAVTLISFTEGSDMSNEAWSAARLLLAYQYPEEVNWEDVDDAYEALTAGQSAAPSL